MDHRGAPITAPPLASLAPPPAIWSAFKAQGAWKSWVLVALLGLLTLENIAIVRLANRPPEFVLVDSDGKTAFVKRAVATEPLLRFLSERTRPPDLAVARFTREFLQLALGIHSATVEANWPAALALMGPELRRRVEAEAGAAKLVDAYRVSQQRTDLLFEDVTLLTRTDGLIHVRSTMARRRKSIVDPGAPAVTDHIAVDLALATTTPTASHPDGLEVAEWSVETLPGIARSPAAEVPRVR